ncbi:MAG: anti-anti-sigma factor [Acidobacteria bacterium]|nr:MAG: anti-anti-sigma factor [Acidobacteriota bacterium]
MIEKQIADGVITLTVKQDVVATAGVQLKSELMAIIVDDYDQYILDFDQVNSIDSSGVGVLIAAQNDLGRRGNKLKVTNVSAPIHKMFRIMRLDKHFDIEPK